MSDVLNINDNQGWKRQREDLLQELNERLAVVKGDRRKKLMKRNKPGPGLTFFAVAPRTREDQEDVAPFVVLEKDADGLWLCCKMSIETLWAGPSDLLLEPDDWSGGYSILVEPWNVILLHEKDMEGKFFGEISREWVNRALLLYRAYCRGEDTPEEIREYCGSPLEDLDERLKFQEEEALTLERVRLHYHEGWEAVDIQPWKKAAQQNDLKVSSPHRCVLMQPEESFPFEVNLEQEDDRMYLRIYPDRDGIRPETVLVDGRERESESVSGLIEIDLGEVGALPPALLIEVRAGGEKLLLNPRFYSVSSSGEVSRP